MLFVLFFLLGLSQAQCPTKEFTSTTDLTNVASLSVVSPISVKYQIQNGTAWKFNLFGNQARLDQISVTFTVTNKVLVVRIVDANAKPEDPNNSAAWLSFPGLLGRVVTSLVAVSLGANLVGRDGMGRMGLVMVVMVMVLPFGFSSDPVDCAAGTLVITVPPTVQSGGGSSCVAKTSNPSAVQAPVLQKAIQYLGTYWFTSPIIVDLDRNSSCNANCSEIVTCDDVRCRVHDANLNQITYVSISGRAYAPQVVTDLEGNNAYDLVVAASNKIYAWEWNSTRKFAPKSGFPITLPASSEIRGLACADVDQDGFIDIFVTTTNADVQVYAYKYNGAALDGWPRYNTLTGPNDDGAGGRNSIGHTEHYGAYGLNVGIGNIDEDAYLEIITTYDDHQIQAFKYNGIAINMAKNFTNPRNAYLGKPLTWGQTTPRWTNRTTDENQYVKHECYPFVGPSGDPCYDAVPCVAGGDEWMQFTQSPASVMDIDGDGQNEVLTLPNSEKGFNSKCNYPTTERVLLVLDGAYGQNSNPFSTEFARSGLRHKGFDLEWPPKGKAVTCGTCSSAPPCTCRESTYYPPEAVPAIAFGDLMGDTNPEIVFGFDDGTITCYDSTGAKKWVYDFAANLGIDRQVHAIDASEPILVDLNQDGKPEVIFTTYGYPTNPPSSENNQNLYILSNTGALLSVTRFNTAATLGDTSFNGNGNGMAGAPGVGDVDGDGQLEILVHTFDGRMVKYTVPGSSTNCMPWPAARGGWLRKGQPDIYP